MTQLMIRYMSLLGQDDMKELITHHDGYGLNESIQITAEDEIGPGGAHHNYLFMVETDDPIPQQVSCGYLQFQRGPRNEPGSIPGIVEAAVLAVLIDRLESFQAGPYACEENRIALIFLNDAMEQIKLRVRNRAERGVLGTAQA
jgi:hypothetical protein